MNQKDFDDAVEVESNLEGAGVTAGRPGPRARTRPHPPGYHKSASAMAECFACSQPELLDFTEEDIAYARSLFDSGYQQISSKHRRLAKVKDVPPLRETEDAMPAVIFHHTVPEWVRQKVRDTYEGCLDPRFAAPSHLDVKELSIGQFRAYKKVEREIEQKRYEAIRASHHSGQ